MIYTVGQSVTSLLDLNRVLNRVVDIAVYVAQAEEGMLMLLDGDELYLRAAREMDERAARTLHVRVDDSIAGRALRAGRPILLAGEGARVPTGYLVKALLYLPLRVPGRGLIGVLGVVNREAEHSFSERDIFLLSGLADYAAIAIENARLFETVKLERGKLQAVLREAQEPIVIVDEEDHVLLCSAAACAVLDLVTADVLGQPVDVVVPHPDLREMFAQVAQTGRVAHREVSFQGRRTFNAQLAPVTGVGRVLVMQDITHLKELDRVKSEFVATISHDLRTPLTSILGYIDLLSRVGPLNAQQRAFIQHVSESTDAITRLISGLLDIGRIEAGLDLEMETCDLVDIIDAAVGDVRPQAEEKGLEVRWRSPEMLPPVRGNPRRLRQVMDNLLANAVKYTHAGGWVSVSAVEEAGYILVHVADSGVGIPLEQQPYIFDKLCRVDSDDLADAAGSRLGLAIVKAVIARHNGRIWVESRPGVGSTFSFILPAMRA